MFALALTSLGAGILSIWASATGAKVTAILPAIFAPNNASGGGAAGGGQTIR